MEVDVIKDVFKSTPFNETFDMKLCEDASTHHSWNSDITEGGCCLIWSPDNYTKSCSRLAERCRRVDEKLQAPVTADILACLKFENHSDRSLNERAQRCLQFSNGFAISVENLFPCDNTPELLAESGSDVYDSELTESDVGFLNDRPYQHFSKRLCIEDPDQLGDCRYYNNPFDPNLSFNGFTEVFGHTPYNNNIMSNSNYCGPNFLLALDNPTALFNEYLREYCDHVKQLSHDIRSVKKKTNMNPMDEVEMIATRNKIDNEIDQLWFNIKNAKQFWDSVEVPDSPKDDKYDEETRNVTIDTENISIDDCKSNILEHGHDENSIEPATENETENDSDQQTYAPDDIPPKQDANVSSDIDFGSDDITSVADIVQRVSRKYADRNYSEQDIHRLLISVLKNKKQEEGRQHNQACEVDGQCAHENKQTCNLQVEKQTKSDEDSIPPNLSPDATNKEKRPIPNEMKGRNSIQMSNIQKNPGEPAQNFPYSSSMFWENNGASSFATPNLLENKHQSKTLHQRHNGPTLNSVDKRSIQSMYQTPYHQPYLHHHAPVTHLYPPMIHPNYQHTFPPLSLQANIHNEHGFRQQFELNKPQQSHYPSYPSNVRPFPQPSQQSLYTAQGKAKSDQRKDVMVQDNINFKRKDQNSSEHEPSIVDHSTPTFVLGSFPPNGPGNTVQHGVHQGHAYNLLQPKPTFILPHFHLPAYHQVHNVQLIPHQNIGGKDEDGKVAVDGNLVHPNDPNYRLDDEIWYINGVPHRHARPVTNTATSLPFYPHGNNPVLEAHNGGINRRIAEQVSRINKTFTESGVDGNMRNLTTEHGGRITELNASNNHTKRQNVLGTVQANDLNPPKENNSNDNFDVNNNNVVDGYEYYFDLVIPDEEITCFDDEESESCQRLDGSCENSIHGEMFNDLRNNSVLKLFPSMKNGRVFDNSKIAIKNDRIYEHNFPAESRKNTEFDLGLLQIDFNQKTTTVSDSVRQIRVLGRNRHKKDKVLKKKADRNQRTLLKII